MEEDDVVVEQTADADLDSGFTGEAPVVPTEEPPKMAQITEDEYRTLLDGVAQVTEIRTAIEKQFGTAFGKIGGIERVIDQLKSSAPAGKKIELTDEVVADLAAEFPEMAGLQLKTLQKFADVINASAPASVPAAPAAETQPPVPAAPAVDEDALRRSVRREITEETLDEYDEKWRDVIGLPDENGKIPDTDFRKWLGKQPADYATKVKSTYSADVLKTAMEKFKADTARAQGRREILDAGATPRGSGGQAPNASPTEDDEFEAGFAGK